VRAGKREDFVLSSSCSLVSAFITFTLCMFCMNCRDALHSETGEETTYFGFVEDIWELDYGTFQIPVLRC
jgi:hypothetical protein